MTALSGVDIAWARPTVAQIKATGAHWVARYFSNDPSKNLHANEVAGYPAAGLGIVVVWETTTGRAQAGHAAGVADGQAAETQRKAVGLPSDMVLHFAVDEDTSWASVAPYFAGVATVIGQHRTGVYGGYTVIEGAAAAGYRYLWQTTAWSAGRWSSHATIRQTGGTTLAGGADWDTATMPDFGQYPRPTTPTPETDVPLTQADATLNANTLLALKKDDPTTTNDATKPLGNILWDTGMNAFQANNGVKAIQKQLAAGVPLSLGDDQVAAVADRLAGNTSFVTALAHAIGADLAARLQS